MASRGAAATSSAATRPRRLPVSCSDANTSACIAAYPARSIRRSQGGPPRRETLVLRKELEDRLAATGCEWADIVQDLEHLSETEIEQHSKRYILRNAAPGCAATVLRILGVALPPLIRCALPPPTRPPRQKLRRKPRRRSANARTAPTNALI